MLWVILYCFREEKTRADGVEWRGGVCREDGEETSDSDGGNGAELPVKVYFTQNLLLFQVSPLQHGDESRTEMLTSFLTTSSPFRLNS